MVSADDLQAELDNEAALIAGLLVDPWKLDDVRHTLRPEMFQSAHCRHTFTSMCNVGGEFSEDALIADLDKRGKLKHMGGDHEVRKWLLTLANAIPSSWGLEAFAGYVRKFGMKILLQEAARAVIGAADKRSASVDELTGMLEAAIDVAYSTQTGDSDHDSKMAVVDYIEAVQSGGDPRVSTHYQGLDAMGAFVPGGLYTLAARSGEGKSSLVANFADRMQKAGTKFGLITVEMTERQMVNSMVGVRTNIDRKRLLSNALTPAEHASRDEAATSMLGGWWVSDREGQTVEDMIGQARAWCNRHKIQVLLVDHLQRVKASDSTIPRHLQVGHITWALKGLARALNIVVILAVQINREGAREGVPKLHHLKESGSVEEDSDGVIAIYVDRAKNDMAAMVWDCELWWLKNRHGALGVCPVKFDKRSGRIAEIDKRPNVERQFMNGRKDIA